MHVKKHKRDNIELFKAFFIFSGVIVGSCLAYITLFNIVLYSFDLGEYIRALIIPVGLGAAGVILIAYRKAMDLIS